MSEASEQITDALYEKLSGANGRSPEWGALTALADLFERSGGQEVAAALRWLAASHKRPYSSGSATFSWFNAATIEPGLGDYESDIPGAIYAHLTRGKESANHRSYPTFREAVEDFFVAWEAARADGWAPEAEASRTPKPATRPSDG